MPKKVILLVEDNPDDEALTIRAFKKTDFENEVIVTRDGAEALDYIFAEGAFLNRDPKSNPEMILLDLQLPKVNGLDVLRRIRSDESTRLIPVIVLTSSGEEKDVIESYNLRANSYIRKPVDFVEFTEVISQLGKYWLVLNESPIN